MHVLLMIGRAWAQGEQAPRDGEVKLGVGLKILLGIRIEQRRPKSRKLTDDTTQPAWPGHVGAGAQRTRGTLWHALGVGTSGCTSNLYVSYVRAPSGPARFLSGTPALSDISVRGISQTTILVEISPRIAFPRSD